MKYVNLDKLVTFEGGFIDERGFNLKIVGKTAGAANLISKLARGTLRPVAARGAFYDDYAYAWFVIPMTREMPHDLEFSNERVKRGRRRA